MPNQNDALRINRLVLDPLAEIYGATFTEAFKAAAIAELEVFEDKTLSAAVRQMIRTRRVKPAIADILEACEEERPRPESAVQALRAAMECKRDEALADKVMRGPIGQLACKLGVAASVWMYAWRDGREITEQAELYRIRDAWKDAVDRLVTMTEADFMYERLKSYCEAICQREREIEAKYAP